MIVDRISVYDQINIRVLTSEAQGDKAIGEVFGEVI